MGAPRVTIKERDLSTVVPDFPGVYGYINIPGAKKGPVGEAQLVTNETQFLQTYTPDDTVGVGYDLAYYSALAFLQRSNKLWVTRSVNGALIGGCVFPTTGSGASPAPISSGIEDVRAFQFGPNDCFLLYGSNPGAWNNNISVKVLRNDKETNAFDIQVYRNDLLEETFTVSRVEGQKDGFGRNIYIEDRLDSSLYIRALDNTAQPDTVEPVYSEASTASFTPPVETQAYTPGSNAITKQVSFDVLTGNSTGSRSSMNIDGESVDLEATDTSPAQVASRIAADGLTGDANVDSVTSLGATVTITYTEAAGDIALPTVANNVPTTAIGSVTVDQAYVAPGTGAAGQQSTFDIAVTPDPTTSADRKSVV